MFSIVLFISSDSLNSFEEILCVHGKFFMQSVFSKTTSLQFYSFPSDLLLRDDQCCCSLVYPSEILYACMCMFPFFINGSTSYTWLWTLLFIPYSLLWSSFSISIYKESFLMIFYVKTVNSCSNLWYSKYLLCRSC